MTGITNTGDHSANRPPHAIRASAPETSVAPNTHSFMLFMLFMLFMGFMVSSFELFLAHLASFARELLLGFCLKKEHGKLKTPPRSGGYFFSLPDSTTRRGELLR